MILIACHKTIFLGHIVFDVISGMSSNVKKSQMTLCSYGNQYYIPMATVNMAL